MIGRCDTPRDTHSVIATVSEGLPVKDLCDSVTPFSAMRLVRVRGGLTQIQMAWYRTVGRAARRGVTIAAEAY